MSINKVFLSGNLTRNPELRQTQSGNTVMKFGIAVNERRKNAKTGEYEDHPNFFNLNMFGKRAEAVYNLLSKGMKVAVEGKLRYSSWETDQGEKRNAVDVLVDEIEIMKARDETPSYYDDDIPFA